MDPLGLQVSVPPAVSRAIAAGDVATLELLKESGICITEQMLAAAARNAARKAAAAAAKKAAAAAAAKKALDDITKKPFKKKKPGVSGKEGAKDKPSWVKEGPREGESGKEFAKRQLDDKYGEGKWEGTGPSSEFNQIEKWADRSFE